MRAVLILPILFLSGYIVTVPFTAQIGVALIIGGMTAMVVGEALNEVRSRLQVPVSKS